MNLEHLQNPQANAGSEPGQGQQPLGLTVSGTPTDIRWSNREPCRGWTHRIWLALH